MVDEPQCELPTCVTASCSFSYFQAQIAPIRYKNQVHPKFRALLFRPPRAFGNSPRVPKHRGSGVVIQRENGMFVFSNEFTVQPLQLTTPRAGPTRSSAPPPPLLASLAQPDLSRPAAGSTRSPPLSRPPASACSCVCVFVVTVSLSAANNRFLQGERGWLGDRPLRSGTTAPEQK